MRIIVTGGAGYIGSHTSMLLSERGDHVVVVDNLSAGRVERIPDTPMVQLDVARHDAHVVLADVMREHEIDAVIHFAARKQVDESVRRPAWYYDQNVGGLAQVLMAMEEAGVERLVFSSSAAVYGHVDGPVDEASPTRPINPYGETKLVGEQLVTAAAEAWGLQAASLRYFNVAGAGKPELGEVKAFNLVPIVLTCLANNESPRVFGNDYPTPDGTCIRDYVHVMDVAEAHLAVLNWLPPDQGNTILNIGTGVGTSVKEMIATILHTAGSTLGPVMGDRRPGDAPSVVALVDKVRSETGWSARFGLEDIARSAYESWVYFNAQSDEGQSIS